MNYRIKKTVRLNKEVEYIPQHKFLLWWFDDYATCLGGSFRIAFTTLKECEEYIRDTNNPIKEISYINN